MKKNVLLRANTINRAINRLNVLKKLAKTGATVRIKSKTWFENGNGESISLSELDVQSAKELRKLISDYCESRVVELNKEMEEL